jgi:hypothetical protein
MMSSLFLRLLLSIFEESSPDIFKEIDPTDPLLSRVLTISHSLLFKNILWGVGRRNR